MFYLWYTRIILFSFSIRIRFQVPLFEVSRSSILNYVSPLNIFSECSLNARKKLNQKGKSGKWVINWNSRYRWIYKLHLFIFFTSIYDAITSKCIIVISHNYTFCSIRKSSRWNHFGNILYRMQIYLNKFNFLLEFQCLWDENNVNIFKIQPLVLDYLNTILTTM